MQLIYLTNSFIDGWKLSCCVMLESLQKSGMYVIFYITISLAIAFHCHIFPSKILFLLQEYLAMIFNILK